LPVDPVAATKLLQLAAAQGHAGAKLELDRQKSTTTPQPPASSGAKQ
jgi:TPR repeat protein